MSEKTVWLIYHKATMDERSSNNMDGSTLSYGVAAVPEADLSEALERLKDSLGNGSMRLLEVYKCIRAGANIMPGEADVAEALDYAIRTADGRGEVSIVSVGDESLDEGS